MQIDSHLWNHGRFKPIPPIIEAADNTILQYGCLRDQVHACAAREDLEKTTNALVATVLEAQAHNKKVICFTTGVPGAGKTLVGLNTVHRPEIKNFASFLSGNGPLVKVIQEALIRDVVKRSQSQEERTTRREAEIEVQAFVHNVHRFADQYYGEQHQQPVQRVIVFDEAQRAWDDEQNERAERPKGIGGKDDAGCNEQASRLGRHYRVNRGRSEEINRGEAGLAEWGRALAEFPEWRVYASPYVLNGRGYGRFSSFRNCGCLSRTNCSVSSAASQYLARVPYVHSEFLIGMNAALSGKQQDAKNVAHDLEAKPLLTK